MGQPLYIGLDAGTTAIKAAAYTADGQMVAETRADIAVMRPQDGWSEQDMDLIWTTAISCLQTVVAQIDAAQVRAIGVCGQGDGLWLLDQDKQPVRPAILWNDQRANGLVDGWISDGTSDALSRFSRTANWPGTSGAALRWVHDNEPDAFAAARHILFCKDWITFRLTGTLTTDFADATIPYLDLGTQTYAAEAFELLGLPDQTAKLSQPAGATQSAGVVLPKLAARLGLRDDVTVATGTLDLASMMVGLGLNVPGDMVFILGTTAVFSYIMPAEPFAEPPIAATVHHPFTNDWIRVLAPQSGASAFDWFAALHPNSFGGVDAGEVAAKINDVAADVPPGANGVIFLPFLTGERAPFVAPNATASFIGMTAATTKADLARAVMEGASFSLLHCLRSGSVPPPERVILTGGGARNPLWCKILADVLGVEIVTNAAEDHGLWGAALIGGAAAGDLDPLGGAARAQSLSHTPYDPPAHATYADLYKTYLTAISAAQTVWAAARTPQ